MIAGGLYRKGIFMSVAIKKQIIPLVTISLFLLYNCILGTNLFCPCCKRSLVQQSHANVQCNTSSAGACCCNTKHTRPQCNHQDSSTCSCTLLWDSTGPNKASVPTVGVDIHLQWFLQIILPNDILFISMQQNTIHTVPQELCFKHFNAHRLLPLRV